jgi:hypothetical protein
MVQLLALAHERACEAELADLLALDLDQGRPAVLSMCRDGGSGNGEDFFE